MTRSGEEKARIYVTIGAPCGSACMHEQLSANFMLDREGALVQPVADGCWGFSCTELRESIGLAVWSVCRVPARALSRQCTRRWHKNAAARNYRATAGADKSLLRSAYMRLIYDQENLYNGNTAHSANGPAHDQRLFDALERRYRTCCNISCGRTLTAADAAEVCFFFGADRRNVSFYVLAVCADNAKCALAVRAEIGALFPVNPFIQETTPALHTSEIS